MDDKTWQLLLNRFEKLDKDILEIKEENKLQTKMISNLKVTVAGVSGTVTIVLSYVKAKIFGV